MDFYFTSLVGARLGSHSVTCLAKSSITLTAFVLCFIWSVDQWTSGSFPLSHAHSLSTPTHRLSTGVLFALVAILYATYLLTNTKCGQGPDGGSSGHFIGYSMAGLPLFTAGQTPSHGMTLLNNPDTMGFWYHVRTTLRGIMAEQSSRRIFAFLCLNLIFTFVELLYGVWTNSLGLISDGFHMLFDCAALVVGLYAAVVAHWKPTRLFSYGLFRWPVYWLTWSGCWPSDTPTAIAAMDTVVQAAHLLCLPMDINMTVNIMHMDTHMVQNMSLTTDTHTVTSDTKVLPVIHTRVEMPICALLRSTPLIFIEIVIASTLWPTLLVRLTIRTPVSSGQTKGVYLHVLADTLGSVGVIFSSYLVSTYGWNIADPICSVFIACAIGYSAMPLLFDTLGLLTLRAPIGDQVTSPQWIVNKVLTLDGVTSVYNPFVWSQTRDTTCVSLCVHVESDQSEQLVLARIKDIIATHCLNVSHLTVQVEKDTIAYHLQALGLKPTIVLHFSKQQSITHNGHEFRPIDLHSSLPSNQLGCGKTADAPAVIKDIIATHCLNVSHLTVQVEKDTIAYHLQALGLKPTIVLHFSKQQSITHNGHEFRPIDLHSSLPSNQLGCGKTADAPAVVSLGFI
ncbi:solute carrier family 30 (zinc transporter), member 5/7 [Paragonimus westermani]|uniref:Solute carrier family 30 (Zinc transporter), member 5/7 n=1 Tax=Paragonimus westermani TaxID=34504 RepID=A0A5J4NS04_9TREM|nr:solute carrier family 30 (zinc transporter), member 5/7 [Paragonimus westermani]